MNITLIILAIIAAAIGIYFLVKWQKGKNILEGIWRDLTGVGIGAQYARFNRKYDKVTPGGVKVMSTVPVAAHALRLLDEGITNQITRHNNAFPHWQFGKQLSDYTVLFVDPMVTNKETEPGSPALAVHGGEFGVIQTAGTCIGVWPHSAADKPYIVLPHQEEQDWHFTDYLMRSAWHESEHIREFLNDWAVFQSYAIAGDIHPHVP